MLLANGVTVRRLWRSKMIVVLLCGEVVNLISLGGSIVGVRLMQGFWIKYAAVDLVRMFLFVPFMAFVLTSILCMIIWALRQGQIISGFLPYLIFFLCIFMSLFQTDVWAKVEPIQFYLLAAGVFIIIGLEWIASMISKEYMCSLSN